MRQTRIINLHGGPGSGKSTAMAATFAELKRRGHLVEMASEWVKLPVWAGLNYVLEDQLYIFAKQNQQLRRLNGAVDFVVTDSPLLLSLVYGDSSPAFKRLVLEVNDTYHNAHVFVERVKPYVSAGRVQGEEKARDLDEAMAAMLSRNVDECTIIPGDDDAATLIADLAEREWS